MSCECAIFAKDNAQYFIQCNECARNNTPLPTSLYYNSNVLNLNTPWHLYHVKYIKNNSWIKKYLNIFCICGLIFWLGLCYNENAIKNLNSNSTIRLLITIFLTLYIIILFGYIDAINKLVWLRML